MANNTVHTAIVIFFPRTYSNIQYNFVVSVSLQSACIHLMGAIKYAQTNELRQKEVQQFPFSAQHTY